MTLMAGSTDPQAAMAEVMSRLTGPGGEFEIVEEDVLGARMRVMKNRSRSLGAVLARSAEYGDRDYIVCGDRRISFTEHLTQVASLSRALRDEYGVAPGDRVAILAANAPEWILSFWATTSMGAIAAGFNAWWSAREVAHAIEQTTPAVLIADARRAALLGELDIPVLTIEEDIPRLAVADPRAALPEVEVDEDDPAVILFTSGTTGWAKGVAHSHRNLLAVVGYHRLMDALSATFGGSADASPGRYLLNLPLFHIASLHNLAIPRLATGSTVVLYQGGFDADRVLRLIERERVTHWGTVPTMAHRLLEHSDPSQYDLSSLRAFSLSSAPSSTAFQERLREALPVARDGLVNSYGLTESGTSATVATPADLAQFPDTVGTPTVTVSVQIRDAFGNPVPDGQEGEIHLRSPFNMLGYWQDPAATEAAFAPDRWFRTGDIGVLSDGRLWLTTRRSDLILRGGENVYPVEIEQCLDEHPQVVECAVLGAPHADLGQEVVAVVVTEDDRTVSEDELRAFTAERLAYFKVPSRWRLTTERLPRNATGKVARRQISA